MPEQTNQVHSVEWAESLIWVQANHVLLSFIQIQTLIIDAHILQISTPKRVNQIH